MSRIVGIRAFDGMCSAWFHGRTRRQEEVVGNKTGGRLAHARLLICNLMHAFDTRLPRSRSVIGPIRQLVV